MATLAAPAEGKDVVPSAEPSQGKLWLLALRAPFLVASLVPAALGILLAFEQVGAFDGVLAALTLVGVACFQLATNMLNDNFDYRSGNDLAVDHKNPFAGGGRVLTTGRIGLESHLTVASAFLAAGTGIGLVIFFMLGGLATSAGLVLLLIGIVGWGSTVFYVGPPLKFAYRGLGEVVVGLSFGPLVVLGAFVVQARAVSGGAVFVSVAMGLLVAAILWINEFPDVKADLSVGKRTGMSRLGPVRSLRVYEGLLVGAFACVVAAAVLGQVPLTALLALACAPLALKTVRVAHASYADPLALIPANAGTILLTTVFGILLIVGVALSTVFGP
jgi:1,4-dihydroxy-2-naphthoate octaprenyltransferase